MSVFYHFISHWIYGFEVVTEPLSYMSHLNLKMELQVYVLDWWTQVGSGHGSLVRLDYLKVSLPRLWLFKTGLESFPYVPSVFIQHLMCSDHGCWHRLSHLIWITPLWRCPYEEISIGKINSLEVTLAQAFVFVLLSILSCPLNI